MNYIETFEHEGYTIRIAPSFDSPNPWDSSNTRPPLVVRTLEQDLDRIQEYGLGLSMPGLPVPVIAAHYKEILHDIGYEPSRRGLYAFARNAWDRSLDDSLQAAIVDAFRYDFDASTAVERMETLAEVYGWLGVPALLGSVQGYTQSDYADILIVATPEWRATFGEPDAAVAKALETTREAFASWVYGSVYRYAVVDPDDKVVASGAGYRGFDHEASGLLPAARQAVGVATLARAALAAKEAPYRQSAIDDYSSDDVQIYADSHVDIVDGGAWVDACVWISDEACES